VLNTAILLTRGVSITWTHHSLVSNDCRNAIYSLIITILLGIYFLFIQLEEYFSRSFSIADGVFGRIFFLATGFHGRHVLVGTLFLSYVLTQLISGKLLFSHHFSFEAAAWYWHFVDVVWLFLYIVVYVWFS
jgi:heme/copper-type cytochrome/quinol oxidase subunit 3